MDNTVSPPEINPESTPQLPLPPKSHKKRNLAIIFVIGLVLILGLGFLVFHKSAVAPAATVKTTTSTKQSVTATPKLPGLQLDTAKNYGNKYANGLLPVGDSHYSTTSAKQGYVYACSQYAQSFANDRGGAGSRGPWFTNNNTQYDINKKLHVQGSVMWSAEFTNVADASIRTITTNDLPTHPTGVFPIAASDPASAYDRNPNTIKGQTLTYGLNANPGYGTPNCMGGEVGVMLTGVALFNAFDAGGRDAGAWEIQDSCSGHPQKDGEYHYHTLSSCIKDTSVHTVIGYALDGFPITGPNVGPNNILTTSDLDECHGITSQIYRDDKSVTMYHYVMTEDFPYSVSCFRSPASQPPR